MHGIEITKIMGYVELFTEFLFFHGIVELIIWLMWMKWGCVVGSEVNWIIVIGWLTKNVWIIVVE